MFFAFYVELTTHFITIKKYFFLITVGELSSSTCLEMKPVSGPSSLESCDDNLIKHNVSSEQETISSLKEQIQILQDKCQKLMEQNNVSITIFNEIA